MGSEVSVVCYFGVFNRFFVSSGYPARASVYFYPTVAVSVFYVLSRESVFRSVDGFANGGRDGGGTRLGRDTLVCDGDDVEKGSS